MSARSGEADKAKDPDQYRPLPDWFAHYPHGIHGIGHAARVFLWSNMIAEQLLANHYSLNIETIRWTAVLHDVGRLSDGIDNGYGARSADWVAGHRDLLPDDLSDGVIDQIFYCCR